MSELAIADNGADDAPYVRHRVLGTTFIGIRHPASTSSCKIDSFRGIKYASIPARFTKSVLQTEYPSRVDATHHGPIAPQVKYRGVEKRLFGLEEHQFPPQHFHQDEFECLSLNITAPANIQPQVRLPVMVWIHGGSNIGGAGSRWILDGGVLVRKSMEVQKPMIVVSINYRLGLFGFAASPALQADNARLGSPGVGNYGLHDQINALLWIQSYISSFGGDPSNVTIFGDSAGASNIHLLMMSNEWASRPKGSRLFTRAILQSGVAYPSIPTIHQQGADLARVMATLRIKTIDELRSVDPEKLVAVTGNRVRPTNDGTFFHPSYMWSTTSTSSSSSDPYAFHPASKLDSLMLGDCHYESFPAESVASLWTPLSATRRIKAIVQGVYKAESLLRAYEITPETHPLDLPDRLLELIGDASVHYSVDLLARAVEQSGTKVFRYAFDQGSPYNGVAHHAVDLLYVFGNAKEKMDGWDESRIRNAIQDRWIAFANGEEPWTPFHYEPPSSALTSADSDSDSDSLDTPTQSEAESGVFVFGPCGEFGSRPVCELDYRRRRDAWHEGFEVPGLSLQEIVKIGSELANGPAGYNTRAKY
ncbi:alpha/beta-hydrolase [Sistotremastrum niveocremeum HHB9708]|uniref:Carboxylic ester hydrolase n=1 Tax=Sistotremastrum niveocremeum HHB9708 TaxID=1314777 RepID=A0A164YSX8_9AGAM|nr:alpha/beta-hydrolase [Sistotremastrum niveocremeum HHB9708]